jgi:hypothetical protein
VLLVFDNEGMSVFDWAGNKCNIDISLEVWEWIQDRLTYEEVNHKVILTTHSEEMTAFHRAEFKRNIDILLKVWHSAQ